MNVRALIFASLAINIIVLVPVCYGLVTKAPWTLPAYGVDTVARRILLSVYFSILIVSAVLMFKPMPEMTAALLLVQIIYKLTTPITVGRFSHPVVMSNIAIAAFHCFTLWTVWRATAS